MSGSRLNGISGCHASTSVRWRRCGRRSRTLPWWMLTTGSFHRHVIVRRSRRLIGSIRGPTGLIVPQRSRRDWR